jgi:protein-histidine pros-kinase
MEKDDDDFKNLRPKAPEILACTGRVISKARLDLAVNGEDCAEHHVHSSIEMTEEREQLSAYALSVGGLGIWSLDLKTQLVSRSIRHDQIFGYSELLPRWTYAIFLEHVVEEDRTAVNESFGAAIVNRTDWLFEYRIRRRDGVICWVEAHARPRIEAGQVVKMIGLIRDITHQKKLVIEIERERSKFRGLFDTAPDPIVIANGEGNIELFNDAAERCFGYGRAAVIGQRVEMLLPERFRNIHVAHRWNYTAQPRSRPMGVGLELYGQKKDGTEFPVDISLSPLTVEGNVLISASIRDMTQRVTHEVERTSLLLREQSARITAERAIRLRDDFMAMVSHDLRNPLTGILLGLELLKKSVELDNKSQKTLQAAQAAAHQMNDLILDLLDLQKMEAGCFEFSDEVVVQDVRLMVQRAACAQGLLLQQKNLSLAVEVPDQLPQVVVHEKRIQQVFQNLLGNAIKFVSQGGRILLKVEWIDSYLWFSVQDNGPGIEESLVPHLFERFSQAAGRAKDGTGLGLYIAKGIVEAHGGKIWAESKLGQGCTIFFTLPTPRFRVMNQAA